MEATNFIRLFLLLFIVFTALKLEIILWLVSVFHIVATKIGVTLQTYGSRPGLEVIKLRVISQTQNHHIIIGFLINSQSLHFIFPQTQNKVQ